MMSDRLADPRRARVWRGHGARRIPRRLVQGVINKAKSGGALVATVIFTAIGLNIIAADQYIAIVLPISDVPARVQAAGI